MKELRLGEIYDELGRGRLWQCHPHTFLLDGQEVGMLANDYWPERIVCGNLILERDSEVFTVDSVGKTQAYRYTSAYWKIILIR